MPGQQASLHARGGIVGTSRGPGARDQHRARPSEAVELLDRLAHDALEVTGVAEPEAEDEEAVEPELDDEPVMRRSRPHRGGRRRGGRRRRLAARERRIVAGDELDEDPAGAGQEDRGGDADDAAPDVADALAAHLQRGGGHDISIDTLLRNRVIGA